MKYFLLISSFFLFACQNTTLNSKPKKLAQKVSTTINGSISNANYPNIIIENMGEQQSAVIQKGQFTVNLMLDESKIYTLSYGRRTSQVFLKPGANLSLSTSSDQFSQVMDFTGDLAVENTFLTEKFNKDRTAKSMKVNIYKLEEQEYIAALEESRNSSKTAFKNFKESNQLDPFFSFLIETEIEYDWAVDRLIYPKYHSFYAQKENFDVGPVYFDFQRDLTIDDSGNMISPNFTTYISYYTDIEAGKILENNEKLKATDNGLAKTKFDVINQSFKDSDIKDFLLYNTLKTHIQYEGANGTPALLEIFNESCNNQIFKNNIQTDYANWRGLETGNVAPTFAYTDIDGQLHDIADYKGKLIYVDVWATWCGPCKKELPFLEQLQEDHKGNDKILFTSISIDKDKGAWERMVKDQNMKGLQLFAEGEWRASIVRDYKISGIPRFLLIDEQGKIVSANAPRPSSERIKTTLATLLQ
ncbi:MAG: thiol-disulfide isomerase/thioredoxin [Saprospiraceae bacterium]|jgi:thiol-disulfide isomerase/thioredoxin